MTETTLFLTGLSATLLLAVAVALGLRRPLDALLAELCGTVERARFWSAFAVAMLVLTPLAFALNEHPGGEARLAPVLEISRQVKWGIIGLLFTLVSLALVMARFIPREAPPPRAPAAGQPARPAGAH